MKLNWITNGKAFFLNFSAGRSVTGTAMVGQSTTGQWISGAKLLGQRSCERGYYKLAAATPQFESRAEAETDAMKLATEAVFSNHETELYLADLDKKSPWKNITAPVLSSITFETQ